MNPDSGTLRRMQDTIDQWALTGDRRAVFLRCYAMMTQNILAGIEQGEFTDPAWVQLLLDRFADYYFSALEAYELRSPLTPGVWKTTFDAAQTPKTAAIQLLLMGVNAHINYDLVLVLVDLLEPEWARLPEAERLLRYRDYAHVNRVLADTIDSVQDGVLEPLEPAWDVVDKTLGRVDEWLISSLITRWREEVWSSALGMISSSHPAKREQLRQKIESATQRKAALIAGGMRFFQTL